MTGSAGRGRRRRGLGLGRQLGLELGDGLGRLAQALVALAELLLETLGLHGGLLEVLVDVVAVVALQGLAELHGAEGVECRLGSVHGAMVAAAPGKSRDSRTGPQRRRRRRRLRPGAAARAPRAGALSGRRC